MCAIQRHNFVAWLHTSLLGWGAGRDVSQECPIANLGVKEHSKKCAATDGPIDIHLLRNRSVDIHSVQIGVSR